MEVIEPSVIYETKDGKYGEDGSEGYGAPSRMKLFVLVVMEEVGGCGCAVCVTSHFNTIPNCHSD